MFIIIKPMRRQKSINKTFTHTCSHQYLAKFSNRCNFRFHFECHLPAGSAALKFNLGGKLIITQQCGCSEHTSIYSRVCIPIVKYIYSFRDQLLGYVSAFRSGHWKLFLRALVLAFWR